MTTAVVRREIRRVRVGSARVSLGAFAGTGTPHDFTPDDHAGSSCLGCFGWRDDPRHPIPSVRRHRD